MIHVSTEGALLSISWDPAHPSSEKWESVAHTSRLHKKRSVMTFMGNPRNLERFFTLVPPTMGVSVSSEARHLLREALRDKLRLLHSIRLQIKRAPLPLRPYQLDAIDFAINHPRVLLALEPRLGKTAVALLSACPGEPILVICPKGAKGVWQNETALWRPDIQRVITPQKFVFPRPGELVILNYERVKSIDTFPTYGTILIADEIVMCQNPKSRRSKEFYKLRDMIIHADGLLRALSGFPISNHFMELWHILGAVRLQEEAYGSWPRFARYCGATEGPFGILWPESPKYPQKVQEGLRKVAIVVKQSDISTPIPPTYRDVVVPIGKDVQKILGQFEARLDALGIDLRTAMIKTMGTRSYGNISASEISSMRKALATCKIPTMIEVIEEYEEVGEPVVVFSAHRAPIDYLASRPGWKVIHGDVSEKDRKLAQELFQAGKLKGIGLTIASGAMAIRLSRAGYVIFVDRSWNPSENRQAADRILDIDNPVGKTIVSLVAAHTLDVHMHDILAGKNVMIREVLGK